MSGGRRWRGFTKEKENHGRLTKETVWFLSDRFFFLDFPANLWYVVVLERQVTTMTTLENLYYGNIAPHEYEVVRGSEYDVTAKLVRLSQDTPVGQMILNSCSDIKIRFAIH